MSVTASQLTFKRMQTDSPTRITVFAALDGTLADGSTTEGPWHSAEIELTAEEQAVAAAIKDRAKTAIAAAMNGA